MRTVKVFSSLIFLLALIIGTGIYSSQKLSTTSKKLENHISKIEDNATNGSWNNAKENLSYFEEEWSKTEKTWAILLDHAEMDNIDASVSKVAKFIESKDRPLTLGEVSTLKQYIKHIPEKESFNIKNIF